MSSLLLGFGLTGGAAAGEGVDSPQAVAPVASSGADAPWYQRSMTSSLQSKLTTAFGLAMTHLQEVPECAALFEQLGVDGVEALASTLYFPAPVGRTTTTCRRANAFTFVGEASTFLCRGFGSLSDEYAAMVLVHEALHHAGLPESPTARGAMRSADISELVRTSCGFQIFRTSSRDGDPGALRPPVSPGS